MNNMNNMHGTYNGSNHMYNSGNPNYGGMGYHNNIYVQNTPHNSMNGKIPFLISSIFIIITGIVYFFLDLLRKALALIHEGKKTLSAAMNYDVSGAINGASGFVSNGYRILNHSVCALTVIQIVTGIVGIVFIAVYSSEKYSRSTSRLKIIPYLCGIVSIGTSIVYAVLLVLAHTSLLLYLFMLTVIFITPLLFTKFALQFYKY